jgi:beta-lactamase regulating signal transducer with metallopeptidase domain
MEQLFIYIIKASGLIAVFYIAYHFLVRKETFFNSNRWFLLSGLLTSLLLPLFFIKKVIVVERPIVPVQDLIPVQQQPTTIIHNYPAVEAFDWTQLIWIGYFIITGVLVTRIVLNLTSLYQMLRKQQIIKKEQFKLINLNDNIAPFSFFNYIVYNPELYSEKELQNILLHEKIHSKGKHSIDVLTAETLCALFWFNPFMWLYKKAITQNLEYIADQKAIKQTDDKKSYQHALLKVVSNQNCLPITNNFYQSLIKKRIVMLNKNQSHRRSYLKYAMILPALIGFVLLFQVKVIAQDKFITLTNEVALANGNVTNQDSAPEESFPAPIISEGEGNYVFDKTETDENLKDDAADIEQAHKISFTISNVKRNSKGEIIGIKMAFDDKKGNNGKIEQDRTIPIRPIFFQVKQKEGKSIIGFYDNPDMVVKPVDPVNENKIITIESIKDDALIYLDGERYTKEALNELDPKGLEKIELLKDAASLAQYGAKDRTEVVVVTTNWPSREHNIALRQQQSPNIITLECGDEVVIFDKCNMKIPGYPSVQFTDNSPVMVLNGVQQKNPRFTLESMPISKIKAIKVLDANDKEAKGTPIHKLLITTK